mmetsp:Transcript_4578/g.16043  ORF Transcript_4578/g.16043 Transcript_4578/m.16043 type:complete len:136 (+) Transcript_4578:907-1314(+)
MMARSRFDARVQLDSRRRVEAGDDAAQRAAALAGERLVRAKREEAERKHKQQQRLVGLLRAAMHAGKLGAPRGEARFATAADQIAHSLRAGDGDANAAAITAKLRAMQAAKGNVQPAYQPRLVPKDMYARADGWI